jgi:hypothetical protein
MMIKTITLVGSILGLIILIISLRKLIIIQKSFKMTTDEEIFSNKNILERRNYLILGIVGLSITSIMQVIRLLCR